MALQKLNRSGSCSTMYNLGASILVYIILCCTTPFCISFSSQPLKMEVKKLL